MSAQAPVLVPVGWEDFFPLTGTFVATLGDRTAYFGLEDQWMERMPAEAARAWHTTTGLRLGGWSLWRLDTAPAPAPALAPLGWDHLLDHPQDSALVATRGDEVATYAPAEQVGAGVWHLTGPDAAQRLPTGVMRSEGWSLHRVVPTGQASIGEVVQIQVVAGAGTWSVLVRGPGLFTCAGPFSTRQLASAWARRQREDLARG